VLRLSQCRTYLIRGSNRNGKLVLCFGDFCGNIDICIALLMHQSQEYSRRSAGSNVGVEGDTYSNVDVQSTVRAQQARSATGWYIRSLTDNLGAAQDFGQAFNCFYLCGKY